MAEQRQLEILKKGPEAWNEWRKQSGRVFVDLSGAELLGAGLRGADLYAANLHNAELRNADLSRAHLRNAELSGAHLSGAHLRNADLSRANLSGADLREADLHDAYLHGASLSGADLSKADLGGADLRGAHMAGANLRGAVLWSANLQEARVTQTSFAAAHLGFTLLADVDLSGAKGLDTVTHDGPSTIGIDTIYRSGGNIPEVFLRGCGVPDDSITYAKSLAGNVIEFYSCFISYSRLDQEFAERLCADLQAEGLRCWYFPESAKWGETVWGEIDPGIKIYDKLVVICSQHSLVTGPVLREIERALQREDRERSNVLFPVRVDDYLLEQWQHPRKADVLSKVVEDFSGWDHGVKKYRSSFERLLDALRAENGASIQPA